MAINENQWKHFKYFSKDPQKIVEKVIGDIIIAQVPRACFVGAQRIDEYSRKKEQRVKKLFEVEGENFLKKWPVVTCALPLTHGSSEMDFYNNPDASYSLVLLDGHHRVRFAPIYGIDEIPTIILSLTQTANAYKVDTLDKMAETLLFWTQDAMSTFFKRQPNLGYSHPVGFERGAKGYYPVMR